MIGILLSIACLLAIVFLLNNKLEGIEDRLLLTQDGELRRMLAKANDTIKKLKKENKQLELNIEIDAMNLY